jgi:hypothetical protein
VIGMSMEHKAFAFDWQRFVRGLRPDLLRALSDDDPAPLEAFIDRHWAELADPYEGEPLPKRWRELLETGDAQEVADFALTRYYRPSENHGIGYDWMAPSDQLPEPAAGALLGAALGPEDARFDPGRMGAYFQRPAQVRRLLAVLDGFRRRELQRYRGLLKRCAAAQLGVYVTF